MARPLAQETKEEILQAFLDGEERKHIAERFDLAYATVCRLISDMTKSGNGIKPDRRTPTDCENWMEHVTPLHKKKMQLLENVARKQTELDKARQELRDYLATIKKLFEEGSP